MFKSFLKSLLRISVLLCFFCFFVAATSLITFKFLVTEREMVVPNLIGLKLSDALKRANQLDLNLQLIEKHFNSEISEDYIINQRPLPDVKVKRGRPIRVIISAGSKLVVVPDLKRKSLRQARIVLHNSGLEIGNVSKVFCSREMKGLVLNQDPLPGGEFKRFSRVNVLVSKGPRYPNFIMPDVIGMKMDGVIQILEEFGLNVEDIVTQKSDVEEGTVLVQQPLSGSPVSFGEKIRLVVSGEKGIIGFEKAGLTYKVLNYKIPRGFFRKKVKIILNDEAGSREIYNRIMRPNAELTLTFGIQGKARVKFFIDGRLQEEKIFEEEAEKGNIEESRIRERLEMDKEIEEESVGD